MDLTVFGVCSCGCLRVGSLRVVIGGSGSWRLENSRVQGLGATFKVSELFLLFKR